MTNSEPDAIDQLLALRRFADSLAELEAAPPTIDGLRRRGILEHAAGLTGRALTSFWHAKELDPARHDNRFLMRRWFHDPSMMHPEQHALYALCSGRGLDVGC